MTLNRMEKIKSILDICVLVFTLIVALSAIFSYYYGSKIDALRKIEQASFEARIAESNAAAAKAKVDAANAFSNAASANERAKQLDLKVEEQKKQAAKSNALAEKAKEEAAKALESAARSNVRALQLELTVEEQKEKAAKAEKELITIKEKIRSRNISEEVWMNLVKELHEFPPQKIFISSSLGDGEAGNYAGQFKRIFEGAGWQVESGIASSSLTGSGIIVLTKNPIDTEADRLINILGSFGIKAERESSKQPIIQLFIGSKVNND